MSLFVLSCKDGWVDIMYDGLDAVGVNQQVGGSVVSKSKVGEGQLAVIRGVINKYVTCTVKAD